MQCINHPDTRAELRCATCGSYICDKCMRKFKHMQMGEKIGFCCESCMNTFLERPAKMGRRALAYAIAGCIFFVIAAILFAWLPDYPPFSWHAELIPFFIACGLWGKAVYIDKHKNDTKIYRDGF